MKIILFTNSLLPVIGGREIVVHHLARSLNRLGHNARVVCRSRFWRDRKLRFDYPVHRWPALKGLRCDEVMPAELLLDILAWGCDVVHAHSTYPNGYAAARLKKLLKLPVVITPHGEDIHVVPEIGFGQRLDPVQGPKIAHAVQSADLLTAISGSVEDSLKDAGAPSRKIRRIPNGVDLDRFQSCTADGVYDWLGQDPSSRLIVSVANYRPVKGYEILIRAMPRILGREPRARLVIVGRHKGQLNALIHELGLDGKVILTGPLAFPLPVRGSDGPTSDRHGPDWLAALHGRSELYVSASVSEGAEGLSLAVIEAMAAGLPVVATDISGSRDVVEDGVSGFLVPPSDPERLATSVLRILEDQPMKCRMGERARKIAERCGWDEIARQYVAVYSEAIERAI